MTSWLSIDLFRTRRDDVQTQVQGLQHPLKPGAALAEFPDPAKSPICGQDVATTSCFRPTALVYAANMLDPSRIVSCRVGDVGLDVAYVGNRGVKLKVLGDVMRISRSRSAEVIPPIMRLSFIRIERTRLARADRFNRAVGRRGVSGCDCRSGLS